MDREFEHDFSPSGASPFTGRARLTVEEIEDAGLLEVVQAPGAGFGHWRILDQLLAPGEPFVFREPLGQSREVKVALSGLFGRFVARAYLTRYLDFQFFAHVTLKGVVLDGHLNLEVTKESRGDLPDWIAAPADLATIAVAEAKGSHDPSGPWSTLGRAWTQANRVHVKKRKQRLSVKRVAVATRWGMSDGGPSTPWIAVRDPVDDGEISDPEIEAAALVGIVRHHIANLVDPLGHADLAASLRLLTLGSKKDDREALMDDAYRHLEAAAASTGRSDDHGDPLIGGIVSRAGPLQIPEAPPATLETLDSLDLRPAFIGVNSALAREAIQGDVSRFRPAPEDSARTAGQILDDTTRDADMDAPAEKADTADDQRHVGARVIRLTSRTPEDP